ncbi:MAG: hypothetical protein SVV03_01235 [Candidatus Nanohaloarchaea archaeon]|nr:hypothetical protein [Candidatus Nanohaloarchaea archaeon]
MEREQGSQEVSEERYWPIAHNLEKIRHIFIELGRETESRDMVCTVESGKPGAEVSDGDHGKRLHVKAGALEAELYPKEALIRKRPGSLPNRQERLAYQYIQQLYREKSS